MGGPMARNLITAGHDVALWSNTRVKAEQLAAEAGGKACATPAEVPNMPNAFSFAWAIRPCPRP